MHASLQHGSVSRVFVFPHNGSPSLLHRTLHACVRNVSRLVMVSKRMHAFAMNLCVVMYFVTQKRYISCSGHVTLRATSTHVLQRDVTCTRARICVLYAGAVNKTRQGARILFAHWAAHQPHLPVDIHPRQTHTHTHIT